MVRTIDDTLLTLKETLLLREALAVRHSKYMSLFLVRCTGDIQGNQLLKYCDEVELDFEAARITSMTWENLKVFTMVSGIDGGEL